MLGEIYERANASTIEFRSTAQFLRDWIQSKKMTTAPGTSRRYGDTVEGFLKHLGAKSERSLGAATPAGVMTYRDQQLAQGKSNKTANLEVKTLRIAFNMARKRGLILTNPAEAVEMLPEMSVGRDTFTRQQILDLLKVADPEWRGMILLGACHGLRLGAAARMTWANVDMERRSLRFFPQKDRRGMQRYELEIPLHSDLEDYILSLPIRSNRSDSPLFPTLSRKKGNGANGLSDTFTRLMVTAGISRESGSGPVSGRGRNVFRLGFHSFRHTAIIHMQVRVVQPRPVSSQKLRGHRPDFIPHGREDHRSNRIASVQQLYN